MIVVPIPASSGAVLTLSYIARLALSRGICAVGFFRSFLPLLGHNLNISLLISDVIPPYRQVVMPLSAGKSA